MPRSVAVRIWDIPAGEPVQGLFDRVCDSGDLLVYIGRHCVYRIRGQNHQDEDVEYIGQSKVTDQRLPRHRDNLRKALEGYPVTQWYHTLRAETVFSIEIIHDVSLLAIKNVTP
jgi:hypothetical protein